MDELTAFERQISAELRREIGPVPSFDTTAIVRSVVSTTPRGSWSVVTRLRGRVPQAPSQGGSTLFSALKFVAAGVIVVLVVGFLVAGVLTMPEADEMGPAAPSPSASPGGTVAVTVDLAAAVDSEVAAILYLAPDFMFDTPTGLGTGFGSFVADVTANPFTLTETIREGSAWLDDPPMSDQPVAAVPAGDHTLGVFVSTRLGPFGEFLPADPIDMACHVGVTVRDGEQTDVRIYFPPGSAGSSLTHESAPCETMPPDTGTDVLPVARFTDTPGDSAAGSPDILGVTTTATVDELLVDVSFAEDWDPTASRLAVWLYPDPTPPPAPRVIQRVWTYTPSSMPGRAEPSLAPQEQTDYCNGYAMDMVWIEVTERPDLADVFGTGASVVALPERLRADWYAVPLTYRVDGARLRLAVPLAALGHPRTLSLHLLDPNDEGRPNEQFPDEVSACVMVPLSPG